MRREDAIAYADRAAASVLGTTAARVAGFAAGWDVSASVFAQFLDANGGAGAEALYLFANAASKKPKAPVFDKHAIPFEVFVAVYEALRRHVLRREAAEAEAERARQASMPTTPRDRKAHLVRAADSAWRHAADLNATPEVV